MKSNELLNHQCDDKEEEEGGSIISSKVNSMMEHSNPSGAYNDNLSIYYIRIRREDNIISFPFLCGTESILEDVGIQLWAGSLLLTDFVLHHKVVFLLPSDCLENICKNICS